MTTCEFVDENHEIILVIFEGVIVCRLYKEKWNIREQRFFTGCPRAISNEFTHIKDVLTKKKCSKFSLV
jgi:thiamine pyrophosphokinase